MNELDMLGMAASGMDAQRIALEASARNVAAAEAAGPGGFARLVPQFSFEDDDATVRFVGMRSEPGSDGDSLMEMVNVLDAQRAYEANASMFDTAKRFAERAIDLGRI